MLSILILIIVSFISCNKDDVLEVIIEEVPKLKTYEVSEISVYSIQVGGEILDEGDSDVFEQGIVIGLSPTPTVKNNLNIFIIEADDSGKFKLTLTSIPSNTIYYIRAYAINSQGIGYGNEIQFKSLENKTYVGDITLSTQDEVIEFGKENYNTIDGSLSIEGSVTGLSPLEELVIVNNEFKVTNTSSLEDFKGLENLKRTGAVFPNGFRIENNTGLVSFQGLNGLEMTRGKFYIINNNSIIDLHGLEKLYAVSAGDLLISDCNNLQNLSGLENLLFIGDSFFLIRNPQLTDISSLSNLNYIARRIYIIENNSLQNLNGLESITTVTGVELRDNDVLTNLDGLNNLTSVGEIIYITSNESLNDLSAFKNIISVEYLTIDNNSSLSNLQGFNNLSTIGNRLFISCNSNLITLDGIEKLGSLASLYIHLNSSLIDIQGLSGLVTITGSYSITIGHNSSLPNLNGLDSLSQVDGSIQIFNNTVLSDFCGLQPLFSNGTYNGYLNFSENMMNPTMDDIINNCN